MRGYAAGAACFAVLISSRRASLTASAVGNAAATSGASGTMTTSCGDRLAYFPRTPPRMSYSGRIVSLNLSDLVVFVGISFTPRCQSRADDANLFGIIGMGNQKKPITG